MEPRFLLPVYLLCYVLVLAGPWPNPIGPAAAGVRRFRTPAIIAIAYVAFTALALHVADGASANLHFG
jgi:hypothetical protein